MGVSLHHGDCLELLPLLADGSIDAAIADIPYGTTGNKWDAVIPFAPMWRELKRVVRKGGAIVLFASQPFTSALIMSQPRLYKHSWVWNKELAGNGILAKVQPLKIHEDIVVFAQGKVAYYPQMVRGKGRKKGGIKDKHGTFHGAGNEAAWSDMYYPTTILPFSGASMRTGRMHPTQKPTDLMEYLIRTYTQPGEVVLDFTMGVGSTGVAAVNTGRAFVGMELDETYHTLAGERIEAASLGKAFAPPPKLIRAAQALYEQNALDL